MIHSLARTLMQRNLKLSFMTTQAISMPAVRCEKVSPQVLARIRGTEWLSH